MIIFILFTTILCYRPIPQNQYIILSTSKFWFNYRQAINSLLIYQQLKEWRINDDQISLMIPEDTACNRKNSVPGVACAYDGQREPNLHKKVNWDFKRNDVNIKYWIDVMRNKYNRYTPQSRRLTLSKEQKLLMFMNGHGGDGYTKMQDTTYLLDFEMEKITKEMEFLELYSEAFLISDSCGAITLFETVKAKNMILLGSSSLGEKAYSHGRCSLLQIPKTDKFSLTTHNWLRKELDKRPNLTLLDQINQYDYSYHKANSKLIINMEKKEAKDIKAADFWKPKQPTFNYFILRNDQDILAQQEFLELMKA
ncbi:unnamed protein product [Paramecium sonneborni]|uniref:Uncharacterized protein n=1 Tax=Paramecium sonneborni TaxID=65129 RepID=A0A8S1LDR7_9CILI|nr:unnamed protein product [Paramecium sonneborni]